jgi:hypothetical protein
VAGFGQHDASCLVISNTWLVRIPEFESYHPSHAVVSSAVITGVFHGALRAQTKLLLPQRDPYANPAHPSAGACRPGHLPGLDLALEIAGEALELGEHAEEHRHPG